MANLPQQDERLPTSLKDNHQRLGHDSRLRIRSKSSESIKAVAIYEVAKGIGALLGAMALWLWHTDLARWLATATGTWRQNFGHFLAPQVESTVRIAQQASKNWPVFLLLIFVYAAIRFIEAYGLWQDKIWAYWFSVIGYGLFIPIELYYLISSPFDWFNLAIFVLNIIIVIVVYRNMKQKGLI